MTEEKRQKKIDELLARLDYLTTRYLWECQDDSLKEANQITEEYLKTLKISEMIDRRFVGDAARISRKSLEKAGWSWDDLSYDEQDYFDGFSSNMEYFATQGVDRILRAEHHLALEDFEEETMEWLRADFLEERRLIQKARQKQMEREAREEKWLLSLKQDKKQEQEEKKKEETGTGEKKPEDVDDIAYGDVDEIIVEMDFLATDFFWDVYCSDGKLIMEKFQEYFDRMKDSRLIHRRVIGDAMQIIGYFQRECDYIVPSEEKESAKKMVRFLFDKMAESASDGIELIEAGKRPIPTKENEQETMEWITADFTKWTQQFQD